jgi:1-acyl-sn-glycerol-3-phosphate acyltransferase
MKASKIRTFWITIYSLWITGLMCFKSVIRGVLTNTNRPWVDKTLHKWTKKILKSAKVQARVVNPYNVEPKLGEATIVMCNHSSLYDIPLSFLAFPKHSMRMLAKKELSKLPFMGKGMTAAEFPFIDRKNRQHAINDLMNVKKIMESGILMWISPEGTRSKDGKLGPFKRGGFITAIESKATIIPIGIRGAHNILPAKSFHLNLSQKAEIHIGQPISAAEYSLENKELLIDRVHAVMKELVGEA